jgi:uncharacterized protein (DUF697 family)
MNETEDSQGRKLASAVDQILADSTSLIALGRDTLRRAARDGGTESEIRDRAMQETIRHFSNKTAVSGGASALTSLLPGVGTVIALAGGTFADVGFLLKYEIEMALVLSHLYGYDIRQESERRHAFLLASITTHDEKAGGNFLVDVAKVEGVAFWNYAPRQSSKILLTVLGRLLVRQSVKGLLRGLPIIGVGVGAAVNKTLTTRVGQRCVSELARRREAQPPEALEEANVVDAHVRDS